VNPESYTTFIFNAAYLLKLRCKHFQVVCYPFTAPSPNIRLLPNCYAREQEKTCKTYIYFNSKELSDISAETFFGLIS